MGTRNARKLIMKVQKVYMLSRGPVIGRLKVQIDGYKYRCGQVIRESTLQIVRIDASGEVTLRDLYSGGIMEFKTLGLADFK